MSFSASPDLSPQPFLVSSPDRVLVRAIPHSLASTNKKVTLSLRKPPAGPAQPYSPTSPKSNLSTIVSHSEPGTAPLNTQSPNNSTKRLEQERMDQSHEVAASVITAQRPTVSSIATAQPAQIQIKKLQFHKNGLPIKSALKSPVTSPVALSRPLALRSHSSPTPFSSPRFVHFNTQLEHVRLFLQGETPSCVAERETIIDSRQDERSNCDIKLSLPNWAPATVESFKPVNIDSGIAPMRVENIVLSEDQHVLEGHILVQNIAFHKHVSVRYTVDFWQTQSEVSAEYEESIAGTTLDRFSFEIPLEMERAAVEKSFCLAVQYQVIGREFWDSNNGMNYQVECKRVVVVAPPTASELSKKMTNLLIGSPVPEYSKPLLKKKLANRYDLSTSLSAAYSQSVTVPSPVSPKMDNNFFSMGGSFKPASQSAYRPSEYISPAPAPSQSYHHTLYASSPKFLSSYLAAASPPDHFHLGYDTVTMDTRPSVNGKRGSRNSWNVELETSPVVPSRSQSYPSGFYGSTYSTSPKSSSPISIPVQKSRPASAVPSPSPNSRIQQSHRPAVGSSSYFDLVDRYCFYESSPQGSPYTSPYSSYPNSPPAPCIKG